MPWYLHLFWGLVVYQAAVELGRGIATAGEWVAKAVMRSSETLLTLQREQRSARKERP